MSTSTTTQTIQRTSPEGNGLLVAFHWNQDRFEHRVAVIVDGASHLLMSSCEGSVDDPWPPSPPLQQVLKQTVKDDPALLGVGMAGNSHWSASFLLCHDDDIALIVDLACAVPNFDDSSTSGACLRATYDCYLPIIQQAATDGSRTVVMQLPEGPGLVLSAVNPHGGSALTSFRIDRERLVVLPAVGQQQGTTQWSYRLSFAGREATGCGQVSS